jgi:OOP family OmpA-OmpF porin
MSRPVTLASVRWVRRTAAVYLALALSGCAWLNPQVETLSEPDPEPEEVNWIYAEPIPLEPDPIRFIEPVLEPEPVLYVYTLLQEQQPEVVLPDPEAVQWIEVARVTRNDWIILLPKADGSVGAVVLRQGDTTLLLNKAYASAHIEGEGMISALTYDATRVNADFGAALAALPAKPGKFLLYFLEGKDQFSAESEGEVERIFADLATRPAPEISVIGHTDAVGSVDFNDRLSLQRADRVRQELVQRGIPAESITVAGRGKRELLVPTSDGIAEAMNRRVEINVR